MGKKKKKLTGKFIKLADWDEYEIQRKADLYTGGNFSAWVRHAGRLYKPKPGEKILK